MQNEAPPPYSCVAVPPCLPTQPYRMEAYGGGPSFAPPAHPQYIPEYPPPVSFVKPDPEPPSKREWSPQGCRCMRSINSSVVITNILLMFVYSTVCVSCCLCPAPVSTTNRSTRRTHCYGGSSLMGLALLALAIWLGGPFSYVIIYVIASVSVRGGFTYD